MAIPWDMDDMSDMEDTTNPESIAYELDTTNLASIDYENADDADNESSSSEDDDDKTSHVYVNVVRGIRLEDVLEHTKPHSRTGETLQLRIHDNHGYTPAEQADFFAKVVAALPLLEHIDVTCPKLFLSQRSSNSGDIHGTWSISLLTSLLRELNQQKTSIVSLRVSHMKLIGTFLEFQEWGQSIRRLTSLEVFSLDKITLGKPLGAPTPPTNQGCWLGPMVEALGTLPQLDHVRILGAGDFQHMTTTDNEGVEQQQQGPLVHSHSLKELCKATKLTSLCLIHLNLTDDNVKHMAEQLQTNLSIKELDMDCTLGRASSLALEQFLQQSSSIEDINLCVRSVEDIDGDTSTSQEMEAFLAAEDEINLPLARGVAKSTLSSFALFRGHLSVTCQDAFRTMIVEQSTLKSLTLFCGDEATNATLHTDPIISFYCKLNYFGRHRLLRNHPLDSNDDSLPDPSTFFPPELSLVDTLGRVSNDVSCLYYFLSLSPSICSKAIEPHPRNKRKIPSPSSSSEPQSKRTRLYRAVKYNCVQYAV